MGRGTADRVTGREAGRAAARTTKQTGANGWCAWARLAGLSAWTFAGLLLGPTGAAGQLLFEEDFEEGLAAWDFPQGQGYRLLDSGDPAHGTVLRLVTTDLPMWALIRGSEEWRGVRMEGSVLFPEDVHNYLGFIFRYVDDGRRADFGSLYIKGNGSYVRVNPHYDGNVGRTLYEEYRTPLEGESAIEIGRWQTFALEVVGSEAHLYVGGAAEPAVTFPHWEGEEGAFGFKARNPGGSVWIDDLRVTAIDDFAYRGAPRPDPPYRTAGLVTDWTVMGPMVTPRDELAVHPYADDARVEEDGRTLRWRPARVDARGAIVTSADVEYDGGRRTAYFHGTLRAERDGPHRLHISSVDNLAIWVDGTFEGFFTRQPYAWWDFRTHPEHEGRSTVLDLAPGDHSVVVRVVGGTYATGGFFMALEPIVEGGPDAPDRP
jgi:hypothetical protein